MEVKVEWLRGLEQIEASEAEWTCLEEAVHERTLYCRYDYILPWYRAYARTEFTNHGEPLVGLVRDDRGILLGVAPMIDSRGSFGKIPVRRADCAGSNLAAGELLIRDGRRGVVEAVMDSLREELRFDLITINGLELASDAVDRLRSHAAERRAPFDYLAYDWYAVADLSEGYEAYLRAQTSNFRKQTRKIAKKVAAAGAAKVERITDTRPDPMYASAMIDRMCAIALKSWRTTSLADELAHQALYRDLFDIWGRRGAVDLSILVIDGRDAAFSLALVERQIYYHTLIAFDDELRELSPGTHLLQEVFKLLPESGLNTVLSHGSYDYKKRWASEIVPQYTMCVFGRGLRARLSYLASFKFVRRRREESP